MTTRIHLIRTDGVDDELFAGVVSLLQAIPGRISFSGHPRYPDILDMMVMRSEPISDSYIEWDEGRKIPAQTPNELFDPPDYTVPWGELFEYCFDFRRWNNIPPDDMVILLTEQVNEMNWFSALDRANPNNGFIHTGDWEHYLHAPAMFPVAYEVIALLLQRPIYTDDALFHRLVHQEPRGCIDDFCQEKKDIILKLRTADICQDCMEEFHKHHPAPVIDHALDILESLREKMLYAQNFRQNRPPSPMVIDREGRMRFPDHSNIEINLRPLEKALYFLFLDHPDGLLLSDLCDHRETLYTLYGSFTNNGGRAEIKQRIDDLTNALSNSASEKMSKIKLAFEVNLGKNLARHYYIQGEKGERRRIVLDRRLVIRE